MSMPLAEKGAEAVMVIGTSLTFYRGNAFHNDLLKRLRAANRRRHGVCG
jgi:hypothetical protein